MKKMMVEEAMERLPELCDEAERGEMVLLQRGDQTFILWPTVGGRLLASDWEDPSLEADLLKAVEGPHRELSLDALQERMEDLIAGRRKPAKPG